MIPNTFGEYRPTTLINTLVTLCHRNHGPWYARLLAPLLRRHIVRHTPLPIDLQLSSICMRCFFRDNYSEKKFVFTPWRYDRRERQLLQQHLGHDGVFLDIGANVGIYTLTALTSTAFAGRIYAFEPNPATRQRLQYNVHSTAAKLPAGTDNLQRVHLLPFGIADKHSQFVLQLDAANLGASSIRSADDSNTEQLVIDCKPLLEVLHDYQIQHIDVLKIDIEGAEDKAMGPYLRAAPQSLLATLIIIENSAHLWQEDVFALLKQRGYQRILHTRMNSVFKLASI